MDPKTSSEATERPRGDASEAPTLRAMAEPRGRTTFLALGATPGGRLVAGLHGVCTPPQMICGPWVRAATRFGTLVCPMGDAVCDAGWGPSWEKPWAEVDADLERSIAAVEKKSPGAFTREGAVLMGFSRGAYIAARTAQVHPGRWPYLILSEADVSLSADALRRARVRAVALFAGEWGLLTKPLRATQETLTRDGFPARLWIMRRAGHAYSDDIDTLMDEALTWLSSQNGD